MVHAVVPGSENSGYVVVSEATLSGPSTLLLLIIVSCTIAYLSTYLIDFLFDDDTLRDAHGDSNLHSILEGGSSHLNDTSNTHTHPLDEADDPQPNAEDEVFELNKIHV